MGTLDFVSADPHATPFSDTDLDFVATLGEWVGALLTRTTARTNGLAQYDPVTGLPNRDAFVQRLDRSVARAARGPYDFAILFVDLDRLDRVRSELGPDTVDGLIGGVATIVRDMVRPKDAVARYGDGTFVVLLEDIHPADVDNVADRVRNRLSKPFAIEGRRVAVEASVGTAIATAETSSDELLAAAGQAVLADRTLRSESRRWVAVSTTTRS